jgi:protein-S-isoprenylcysteine O-methyltransferase Ste14
LKFKIKIKGIKDMQEARVALIKQTVLSTVMLSVMMLIFYVSAGHIDIPRSRVFIALAIPYFVGSNLTLYRYNPTLLKQRLKIRRKGSKTWDEVLMRISNLTALLILPTISGLDIGRYRWSSLGSPYMILGIIVFLISSVLINWAMIENPYFESTVRIQEERGHQVITTGPYAIVRHPGYLSGILWIVSIPLILGSLYGLIPAIIYSALMSLRTYLEDRTLQKELPGYASYAETVKYKLFPGIW